MTARADRIRAIFNELNHTTLHLVDELYSEDVEFIDPFHHIQGRTALRHYYAAMYQNVQQIRFDFTGETMGAADLVLYWRMTYRHPRIAGGKPVSVEGCTRLVLAADGKVRLHRDYFDAGAMMYEHLPVLGRLVRFVRERVG